MGFFLYKSTGGGGGGGLFLQSNSRPLFMFLLPDICLVQGALFGMLEGTQIVMPLKAQYTCSLLPTPLPSLPLLLLLLHFTTVDFLNLLWVSHVLYSTYSLNDTMKVHG